MPENKQDFTKVEEINFTRILTILLRGKWLILSGTLIFLLGVLVYLRYTTPLYQASCNINVESNPEQGMMFTTQVQKVDFPDIIKSRGVLEPAVRELDLYVNYYQAGNFISSDIYNRSPFLVKYDSTKFLLYNTIFVVDFIDENTFTLYAEFDPENPITCNLYKKCKIKGSEFIIERGKVKKKLAGVRFKFKINTVDYLVSWMKQTIKLNWFGTAGTGYIVMFTDPVPERARDCANKVCEIYMRQELDIKKLSAKQTVDYIDEQLGVIKSNMSQSEQALSSYESKYKIPRIENRKQQINTEFQEIETEYAQLNIKTQKLDALYQYMIEKFSVNTEDSIIFAPNAENVFDQVLTTNILKLNELLFKKIQLLLKHTHNSPIIQQLNTELIEIQQRIHENIQFNRTQIAARKAEIQSRIRQLEQNILNYPLAQRGMADIQRDFTINEGIYSLLLQKRTEAAINMAATVSKSRIIDLAQIPMAPISPQRTRTIAFAILSGLAISLVSVVLRELLRKTISYKSEIEERILIPIAGTIIRSSRKDESTLKVLVDTRSALTESFRHLRSNVLFLSGSRKNLCISVTSTISGEGKSFISINLAAIASNTGRRALLIDFDLRKPRLHQYFGINNDIGISSVLLGMEAPEAVIKSTGFQDFDVITAGPLPVNPAELIANEKLNYFVEYYRQRYDYVFFDTSPVGLVTDALILLKMSDVSLYVVRADYSKKTFLNNIETIRSENQLKNLYLVFNYVDMAYEGYGYGYGYNYGYGYGYYIDSAKEPWWKFWKKFTKNS